ncbi:uncharacterized protein LOC129777371 [Toxorhynchites rutilus septentrionalis]|uniref:uncharacterized protein LOC129777371 n=1 Tax=Toxorhynchites rutilus septentrionalis TaxID=329112 RepID=UPI002479AFA2|nr:uncharacterized protein LOC129777371 [Toxorhynchites rutilus septentrionalis]
MIRTILKLAYNRQKSLARNYVRRARNPGVDRRMALLKDDSLQTNHQADLEQLDDADFSQVHKSHKQYERETQQYRERLQSWIVGNKYFKTKQLNFLTWSEKEQIRYLHNFDPEQWSIDKLVESFPADRYTIAKIVKAKWIPRDANRIQQHDESVRDNWEMLKSGRIKNIDSGFAEHLKKFIHRNFQEAKKPKVESKRLYEIQPLPEDGEFSRIITSCKKYNTCLEQQDVRKIGEGQQTTHVPEISAKAPDLETFVMGEIVDRRPRTLRQMNQNLYSESVSSAVDDPNLSGKLETPHQILNIKKYESEVTTFDASDNSKYVKSDSPDFVKIPKKLYKKGVTYQLDDCFYDDDGEFLYRVPGMTGRTNR